MFFFWRKLICNENQVNIMEFIHEMCCFITPWWELCTSSHHAEPYLGLHFIYLPLWIRLMLFWKFGNPLIWPQELQRDGDVRREKSTGRSVMGIYSWVGAWNLNRGRHCSRQVLRGGQTGCMLGKGGGREGGVQSRSCRGGNRFFGNATVAALLLWQDETHEPHEADRKSVLQHRSTLIWLRCFLYALTNNCV